MSGAPRSGSNGQGHQFRRSPGSSSDGSTSGSEGGAPLDWQSPADHNGPSNNNSLQTSEQAGSRNKQAPHKPSEKQTRAPVPVMSRTTFNEKLAALAAGKPIPEPATTSGGIPPALTLAAYPGPAPQGTTVPKQASIPKSTTETLISAMQSMSVKQEDKNVHSIHKAHRDLICRMQARIWGLRQGLHRQSAVPKEFVSSFDYDIKELMGNTVKLNQSADALAAELKQAHVECEHLRAILAQAQDRMGDLEREARFWKDRDEKFEAMQSSFVARSAEDMQTIQFLNEQLRRNEMARQILQDQVDGKRSLWMKVHNNPKERAAAMESLNGSPLSGQTFAGQAQGGMQATSARSGGPRSDNARSKSSQFVPGPGPVKGVPPSLSGPAFSGQSQQRRLQSSGTSSFGQSTAGSANSGYPSGTRTRPSSGPSPRESAADALGSPLERRRGTSPSLALVRRDPNEGDAKMWDDEFQSLFAMVYGFCTSYFNELPRINGDWKTYLQAEAGGNLWEYMCAVCDPGARQARGERALRLLQEDATRPYLMQRLILQQMLRSIFTRDGWKDYSAETDAELKKIEEELKTVHPCKTYERQALIDRQAKLFTEMAEGPHALKFKNHKVNGHHQRLKLIVTPFLPRDKNSNLIHEALFDLFTITGSAWDLSAKVLRSHLTFQYVWNDGNVRFSAETHKALNLSLDPLMLQQEHFRVRLCVSPAITMRNDQGLSINAKNISQARVLVMRG